MLKRLWWRLIALGFRLLYNELAWTYDTVSWIVSLGQWRSWQQAALRYLDIPPEGRVLELAHGTGNLQMDLQAAGLTAVGYDLSPYMGRIARRKLLRRRIVPVLIQGRAQALPFAAASFPAVVSTFPTEFIVAPETLREVHRVLQPGGRLVIVVNGVLTGGGVLRTILEWAYRVTGQRGDWPGQPGEPFAAAGFSPVQAVVPCRRSNAQVMIAERLEQATN